MLSLRVSETLSLEELNESDATDLFKLVDKNRSYLRRWLPWLDYNQEEKDCLKFIQDALVLQKSEVSLTLKIVQQKKIVGILSHHPFQKSNRSLSIGYWIDKDSQGQGIMTACVRCFVSFLFKNPKVNRVEINCAVENEASNAIPKKLGFVLEGVKRDAEWLYDHFVDHRMYSLLKREFIEV